MKNKVLAAIAALAIGGCKQSSSPEQSTKAPTPVAPSDSKPTTPEEPNAVKPSTPDPASDVERIGLPHDDRGHSNHLSRAKDLKSIGELDGALVEARRAAFEQPDDEDILKLIARLSQMTRNYDLAVTCLERLAQLSDGDPQPLLQAARIEVRVGKFEDGMRLAKAAMARDSDNPDAYQVLGRVQLAKGELSDAIQSFKKAVDLAPDHGYALNNLGFAYLRANMNEEAVEVLEQAAEILPNVAYVHNNLGVAYERVGRHQDAELEYAQSTSLSPKYVKAQVNSARIKRLASAKTQPAPTAGDIDEE